MKRMRITLLSLICCNEDANCPASIDMLFTSVGCPAIIGLLWTNADYPAIIDMFLTSVDCPTIIEMLWNKCRLPCHVPSIIRYDWNADGPASVDTSCEWMWITQPSLICCEWVWITLPLLICFNKWRLPCHLKSCHDISFEWILIVLLSLKF